MLEPGVSEPAGRSRRRALVRAVRVWLPALIGLAAIALAILAVIRDRDSLALALRRMGPGLVILSFVCALGGVAATFLQWRAVLRGLGARTPAGPTARIFFTSQLGKYLPGSVWPVLAQMEFGRREGIQRRTMLSANLLTLAVNLATGLVVAAVTLPASSSTALHRFWWVFLALPLLLALLHPRGLTSLIDWAFRRIGRAPMNERLPLRATLVAGGWGVLSWLLLGLHLLLITRAFGAGGWSAFLAATGGEALAVSAGVLFIPAPAGAGIRDAVLTVALAASLSASDALAGALMSRALLILVDLSLAGLSLLGGVRLGRYRLGGSRGTPVAASHRAAAPR